VEIKKTILFDVLNREMKYNSGEFKWGTNAHVSADDFDFAAGLNKLMDVLDQKIKKEKDKVQH